jgi:hypothetical protein
MSQELKSDPGPARKLLQSGIILSAVGLLTGFGNYAFQAIISRRLEQSGEYGLANSAISFMGLLGLPLAIATAAVTHYIARFNFSGDDARLQGLLAGCRKFLFRLTIAGSVLAALVVIPLSDFFHFPRTGLMLVALGCVLAGLWGAFATALCQGLAWFKRLAFIGLLAMCLRLAFGWLATLKFPTAETVVLASGIALLANLVLFFWRKNLSRPAQSVSPWNREFVQFLIVAAACIGGGYCFTQGDLLVAKRYFPGSDLDAYTAAGLLARALPMTVAPLLTVLFTHRSGKHTGDSAREQLKLLGFYAVGLVGGAIGLFVLRTFCLTIIARNTLEAADMIEPLATTMVFVGLLQALAIWALASRWLKIALLYGGLGLAYWLLLLCLGKSPADLLRLMPTAAGIAFGILFVFWMIAMRTGKTDPSTQC